jgi:hypothetical protein
LCASDVTNFHGLLKGNICETRKIYKIFVVIPERKRPLGRFKRNWEDDIKIDSTETCCEDVNDIEHVQYRICFLR